MSVNVERLAVLRNAPIILVHSHARVLEMDT